jgi:long-chain acyl-CoA synthetase
LLDIARANWLVVADADAGADSADGVALERLLERDRQPWFSGARAPAQMLFTSGSSGVPKAVMLSHESLLAAALECADSIGLRADDVQMTTVPFTHAYGQNRGLNATLYAGASIAPVFEDDLGRRIAALKRVEPTVLLSMAGFFGFLAFSKQDLGTRLRVAVAGAAPLPVPVMERFQSRYGIPLLTTYGLTEFLIISCQRLADRRTSGTVGYPSRGVDVRIVDDEGNGVAPGVQGRILVRGCLAMDGYLGLPDKKVSADGWLDTEDIGILDADGLRVLGRASSFIKRSGYKVYPSEIQNCLASHPDVIDVAVAKFTSMLGGEELAVEVVLEPDTATSVDDLLQYCRDRLPPYKVPARCVQVEAIPRLPSGKPDLVRIGRTASGHA